MRNRQVTGIRRRGCLPLWRLLPCLFVAGCVDQATKENLTTGYTSFEARQYDASLSHAESALVKSNGDSSPGSAEALYLKGRSIEERAKKTRADATADLSAARTAYVNALGASPPPKLEPFIHASIANVAYWQDDYAAALQEWQAASKKFSDADTNAFVLYRIGLCQQRLGQFAEADKTFANVQQERPGAEVADRARAHAGARSFALQLATYSTVAQADAAMTQLAAQHLKATNIADPRGRHVVSVGPFDTYLHASQMRSRLAALYPEAIILP